MSVKVKTQTKTMLNPRKGVFQVGKWSQPRRPSKTLTVQQKKKKKFFQKVKSPVYLNGGNWSDPLNLNSLPQSSTESSPAASPAPKNDRNFIPIVHPLNTDDPLNLNGLIDETCHRRHIIQQIQRCSRRRYRGKRKDGQESGQEEAVDTEGTASRPRSLSWSAKSSDKVVSPVTHISPRKRRRTYSDCATGSELSGDELVSPSKRLRRSSGSKHLPEAASKEKEPLVPTAVRTLPQTSKFQYGNYHRYYGYRNSSARADPRLAMLDKSWFEGKQVLDIGCNAGHVTLEIARGFKPQKIVGMDIDKNLIDIARKNIRHYLSNKQTPAATRFPVSNKITFGPLAPPFMDGSEEKKGFPYNIMFVQGNIVLDSDDLVPMQREEYDVILALSVTKWIHLNWGDDGLKRTFHRIFRQLRPGGIFILEPQSFASYKKRKKLTERINQNYQSMLLRPEHFNDYLCYEVGFHHFQTIGESKHEAKGFCRPIVVFWKAGSSPYQH